MFKLKPYPRAPRPSLGRIEGCRGAIRPVGASVVLVPKAVILRSEPYRRYVASQECFSCRLQGFSQAAHANEGNGVALKVCDSRIWSLCAPHHGLIGCHQQFDLAIDMGSRDERRELANKWVVEMRAG